MRESPSTYAAWSQLLTELSAGEDDEAVLLAMKKGTLAWQSGVAERFTEKFGHVLEDRLNRAIDGFQKGMSRVHSENDILRLLLALRKELSFLAEAADLPALPEKIRESYKSSIYDTADRLQSSLEDSAKSDRSGRQRSLLRSTKVNSFIKR